MQLPDDVPQAISACKRLRKLEIFSEGDLRLEFEVPIGLRGLWLGTYGNLRLVRPAPQFGMALRKFQVSYSSCSGSGVQLLWQVLQEGGVKYR